jgi:hypothetical protein
LYNQVLNQSLKNALNDERNRLQNNINNNSSKNNSSANESDIMTSSNHATTSDPTSSSENPSVSLAKKIVEAISKAVLLNQVNLPTSNVSAFKPPSNHYSNIHPSDIMMMPPSKEAINFQNDSINDNNSNSKNNSSKLGNRHKNKPLPLVIPSDISSFAFQQQQQQQQQQQLQNSLNYSLNNNSQHSIPYFHQMSANPSTSSSHQYPTYTLLKSPRLALQSDLKKQYTPPPMLSPFRKGPGLYYKYFANMFLLPNAATAAAAAAAAASLNSQSQFNHHQQQLLHQNLLNSTAINRPPLFNHSMSCSHIYPPTQSNFYNSCNVKSDLNKENNASFISEDTEEAPHLNELSEVCDENNNLKDNIEEDDKHESNCSEHDQTHYNNKTISNDQAQEEKENNIDDQDEISIKNLKEHVLTNNNEVNIKQQLKRPRLSKIKQAFRGLVGYMSNNFQ